MSGTSIQNNEFYKKKYLKYKLKYLELKKSFDNENMQGGIGWTNLMSYAKNFVKSNPNAAAGLMGNVASGVSNLNLSNGISNIGLIGFKTFLSQSPQYQELVHSGLMTPQNEAIMFELLKLFIGHLADPLFYPIMLNIIKNIMILAGSVETFNIELVLPALNNLYTILNEMKADIKYQRDFILLTVFLRDNKAKIFNQIKSRGMGFPGFEFAFNRLINLISIPLPQQQMYQQPQQMYQQPQQMYQQQLH